MRLTTIRTCSRSAAWAGANPTPNRRLARTRSLTGCRIWEIPFRKGRTKLSSECGPDHPLGRNPRWNSQPSPRFTPLTEKFSPLPTGRMPSCLGCKHLYVQAGARARPVRYHRNALYIVLLVAHGAESQLSAQRRSRESLFTQILERHRDAVVIELLVIAAKVAAAIGATMKILRHHTDWRVRLAFESGRAANVDRAVEIEIVDIVVEIADQQSGHWLIADAQHLGARANWSYVLVAPSDFVIETQASDGRAVGIEINPLGPSGVVVQVLWKRHFHTSNHIDDHAHLLSLGPLRRAKTHHQSRRKRESPDRMGH